MGVVSSVVVVVSIDVVRRLFVIFTEVLEDLLPLCSGCRSAVLFEH